MQLFLGGAIIKSLKKKGISTMSEIILKKIRNSIGINGIVSTIMGVLILFWPGRTAQVGTVVVGIGFILIGIAYLISIFALKNEVIWSRFGHLLLSVIYLVAGSFSLVNLGETEEILFIVSGLLIGFTWITEGILSFAFISYSPSKFWTILSGLINVIAGLMLLFAPLWGAMLLWTLLGIVMLILGVFKLVRYFTW